MNHFLYLFLLYMVSGGVVIYTLFNHAPTLLANFLVLAKKHSPRDKISSSSNTMFDYFIFLLLWPIVVLLIIYAEDVFKLLEEMNTELKAEIVNSKPFSSDYQNGLVEFKEIKVYLAKLKMSGLDIKEWDYLGISEEEYRQYLLNPEILKIILDERRKNQTKQEPA
ncbi:hypothetical protein [Bdellovibrio sp. BCCA]|uniref:hypothetical protein n=1 Tax=Bdellovibrio sp. BCCA TaxID=3136281 RepID=UPI0030F2FA8E